MGRRTDEKLWFHWLPTGAKHMACRYCAHTILKHAKRCREHTGTCSKAPQVVRQGFLEISPSMFNAVQALSYGETSGDSGKAVGTQPNINSMKDDSGDSLNVSSKDINVVPCTKTNVAVNPGISAAPSTDVFKKLKDGTLDQHVMKLSQTKLKELQADFVKSIVSGNISFNWLHNYHLQKFFMNLGSGFKLPSRKEASGSILNNVHQSAENNIDKIIRNERHVALIPDGWQNIRGSGVVNIMVGNPNVIVYLRSFETGSDSQDTVYVKQKLNEAISTILHSSTTHSNVDKVVAIVSDQGSGYKQARNEIQRDTGGKILSITCAAHLLNLLAGDICKLPTIQNVISLAKGIVKDIKGSKLKIGEYNVAFEKYIADQSSLGNKISQVSLTLPVCTRWYSIRNMFDKLLRAKPGLERMAINQQGRLANEQRLTIKDDAFWCKLNQIYPMITDITNAIGVVESNIANISDVVQEFAKLAETFTNGTQKFQNLVNVLNETELIAAQRFYKKRSTDGNITVYHFLANMLDPRYRGQSFENDEHSMSLVLSTLESYGSSIGVAVTIEERRQLGSQLTAYKMNEGLFSSSMLYHDVPNIFWKNYLPYESTKLIANIGCRLLSIPATSAAVERSFSVQSNVHSKTRNRLGDNTIDKLMRVKWQLHHEVEQSELTTKRLNRFDEQMDEDDDEQDPEIIDELVGADYQFTIEELQEQING